MQASRIPAAASRVQAGFTLVELMVGMLVGLVATIVMFQMFAVSENQKRTTTGGGDAQQNGVTSLFQLEREARMAGFGLNDPLVMGCDTYGVNSATGLAFNFPLAPVVIQNGAAGAPDRITFLYGNKHMVAPEPLTRTMGSEFENWRVGNRYGFNPGDVVLAVQVGQRCAVGQVQSVPAGAPLEIVHTAGGYADALGVPRTTKFNGGLTGGAYIYTEWIYPSNGGRLMNLGDRPVGARYYLQNNQLMQTDTLGGLAANDVVVSDGIVQMQAQYGFDGNGDGSMDPTAGVVATINIAGGDQWGDALPAGMTPAAWARVNAVRLALVARSMTPEKPSVEFGPCDATLALPRWNWPNGGGVNIDITADANWNCYRYRIYEVVVPLRNVSWIPLRP